MLGLEKDYIEALVHRASAGVVVQDRNGRVVYCNPAGTRMLQAGQGDFFGSRPDGFVSRAVREDGSPFPAAEHPAMVTRRTGQLCRDVVMGLVEAPGGRVMWTSVSADILPGRSDADRMVFAVFTDITEPIESRRDLRRALARQSAHPGGVTGLTQQSADRRADEANLRRCMAQQHALLTNVPVGISVYDRAGRCEQANPAMAGIFGYRPDEIVGQSLRILYQDQATFEAIGAQKWPIVLAGRVFTADVPMRRKDGAEIWVRQIGRLVDAAEPELGLILAMEDVTWRRALEARLLRSNSELRQQARDLEQLAMTDALTGLANRRAAAAAIELEFERFRRYHESACVLMVDIDHFKLVNDAHGHDVGDLALAALASILAGMTRVNDLAARFGGEEFVLLLPATEAEGALDLAERLRASVASMTLPTDSGDISLTVSIGVAMFRETDETWLQAVARADEAMYRAKEMGRNRVEI